MPLIRGMARTAVVAGTATAVSNRVSRRQANRWAAQEEYSPAYMSPQAPPSSYEQAPPPPAAAGPDPIERLKELGELHTAGVLTDEEFAVQKAKILNA
jgi:hypothetical protein